MTYFQDLLLHNVTVKLSINLEDATGVLTSVDSDKIGLDNERWLADWTVTTILHDSALCQRCKDEHPEEVL